MSQMSKIVRTISNIIFPFIMIFGLYVIAHGHLTPGGGFQGGAVAASGCVLLIVAYGSAWIFERIKVSRLSIFESTGALGFIGIAFLGLILGGVFFKNFLVGSNIIFGNIPQTLSTSSDFNTAGALPLMNFAVGVKVISGLFVIVLIMAYASCAKEWKK